MTGEERRSMITSIIQRLRVDLLFLQGMVMLTLKKNEPIPEIFLRQKEELDNQIMFLQDELTKIPKN